ncbi:2377_t:CDS:2 [Entrophospora sp. SA101]|nr:5068_t:CDS:2 [Entrophospora sp. SA101]CAJ0639559.1 2377_t:CDS:2 [Entrophospora sp. SA101]CAJ0829223.1 5787_t:CDS:2 [Entrophospora sp. SA101]CAJ0832958.1 15686_t:CDS:2 [Entrophospora sp. SA101]
MLKGDKKADHFVKLEELLEEYPSIFIVNVDNVGSNQMQHIRHVLRNKAIILMEALLLNKLNISSFTCGLTSHNSNL